MMDEILDATPHVLHNDSWFSSYFFARAVPLIKLQLILSCSDDTYRLAMFGINFYYIIIYD